MRRLRVFLALAVFFGVALVTTGMVTPGRTAATAVLLTAVLAGISVILVFRWEGVKDSFETRFEVRPPLWRLQRARANQTTAVVQFIVGAKLGKLAEALGQTLRQQRKTELEQAEFRKANWSVWHKEGEIQQFAEMLLKVSKARRDVNEAKSAYKRAARLAKRFGLRVCKSYQDYLPRR